MNFAELGISVRKNGLVEQRSACPQCSKGRRDNALGFNVEDGRYHCFRCGWHGRAGDFNSKHPGSRIARIDDPAVADRKRERLRKTWRESVPLNHQSAQAVRRYLESRALGEILKAPPVVLRAHPALEYWDGTHNLGAYAAMVALFHGASGQPVTLHVTYLRSDGCCKASVPSPKKILGVPVQGSTRGGAIHLYEPRGGKLGISEGIESALSLHVLQGLPVWASFCADNLARVQLPRDLRELHIGIDLDASGKGEQVAKELTARVRKCSQRIKVWFVKPELEGLGDLNDELRRRAC